MNDTSQTTSLPYATHWQYGTDGRRARSCAGEALTRTHHNEGLCTSISQSAHRQGIRHQLGRGWLRTLSPPEFNCALECTGLVRKTISLAHTQPRPSQRQISGKMSYIRLSPPLFTLSSHQQTVNRLFDQQVPPLPTLYIRLINTPHSFSNPPSQSK